jgi:uncharacterized protein (DUF1015 family)
VAEVRPFRALRYDEDVAGPLDTLVAPPYDVISEEERQAYLRRSPHNVVHLTLPDSEEQAGRDFREWLEAGVLSEEEPAFWALEQQYTGPDGVERIRRGIVASLKAEPYDRRVVLPHERTHRGPKEGRLRLVQAVGAQLEPIFLLYDGLPPVAQPAGAPAIVAEGTRLWPLTETDVIEQAFADRQLVIADGHHRYETAVEFAQQGGSPWLMVVLVSTTDPGLMIFPTHRVAERFEPSNSLLQSANGDPLAALDALPPERAGAVVYTRDGTFLAEDGGRLDTALVESLGPQGVSYTADARRAIAAVDEGRAQAAFLLRATRIEDVFAVAQRGETMPQKSTYFYPKLVSGLLFHPL